MPIHEYSEVDASSQQQLSVDAYEQLSHFSDDEMDDAEDSFESELYSDPQLSQNVFWIKAAPVLGMKKEKKKEITKRE